MIDTITAEEYRRLQGQTTTPFAGTITAEEFLALQAREGGSDTAALARKNKYGAVRCEEDGYKFDSLAERARYHELRLRERAGEVRHLRLHTRYDLVVNGVKLPAYEDDFAYEELVDGSWVPVVEDVKSPATRTKTYTIKRLLMLAVHGIAIREVDSRSRS